MKKEGSKVWIVQECEDETNMLAIPQKPQMGIFLKNEESHAVVFVDNDLLYIAFEEVFLYEIDAWRKWHRRMSYKIGLLEQQIQEIMETKEQYAHPKN